MSEDLQREHCPKTMVGPLERNRKRVAQILALSALSSGLLSKNSQQHFDEGFGEQGSSQL